MANGSNYLGELQILVSADWSGLQSDLQDAQQYAQQAGASIASAFTSIDTSGAETALDDLFQSIQGISDVAGAAEQSLADLQQASSALSGDTDSAAAGLSDLSEAADRVATDASGATGSVEGLGAAAEGAGTDAETGAAGVDAFGAAAGEAASSAEEAGGGISVFRASLLELAEGLAITDALKDFGQEALTAYSSIQTATVALTAMTGSAETATSTIESLEAMSERIPVSLSSLVDAQRQMTAFGLSAQQTSELLNDAANASAASGFAFQQVGDAMDRLVLSGQAGARQLATLGLSTQAMAQNMEQFGVAADATSSQVSKAFGSLTIDERISVINAALEQFGGIASEQAQTVAGQWQILKNQWDISLEAMGADLAPLATRVMSFASQSVIPAIEGIIDIFNKLPGPIQDLAATFAIVLGASGPILTGIAGLSLAVMGLQSVPEVLAKIAGAFGAAGIAAEEMVAPVTGAGAAAATAGTEASAGATGFTELAAAETAANEAALPVGAVVGAAATAIEGAGAVAVAAAPELEAVGAAVAGAGTAAVAAGPGLIAIGTIVGGWAFAEAISGLGQLHEKFDQLHTDALNLNPPLTASGQVLDGVTAQSHTLTAATGALSDTQMQFYGVLTRGLAPMQQVVEGEKGIVAVNADAQKAYDALTAAVAKHESAVSADEGAVTIARAALAAATPGTQAAATASANLSAAQVKLAQDEKSLATEIDGATAKLTTHKQLMDDIANATVPSYAQSVENATAKIETALNAASADLLNETGVWVKLQASGTASAQAISDAAAKMQADIKTTGDSASEMSEVVTAAMSRLGISFEQLNTSWQQAVLEFGSGSDQAQQAFSALSSVWQKAGGTLDGLTTYVDNFTGGLQAMSGVMVNGRPVWVETNQDMAQMEQALMSVVPGFGQATTAADGMVTVLRGSHAPITGAVGDLESLVQAQAAAEAAATKTTAAHNAQNAAMSQTGTAAATASSAISEANSIIQLLGGTVQDNTFDWKTWNQQIDDLVNSTEVMDPAVQQAIELLNEEAQAASNAADGIDALSQAQGRLGKGGGGGGAGGGGGQGFALGNTLEQMGWNASLLAMMPFSQGALPGFGGVGLGVDSQAVYQSIVNSLGKGGGVNIQPMNTSFLGPNTGYQFSGAGPSTAAPSNFAEPSSSGGFATATGTAGTMSQSSMNALNGLSAAMATTTGSVNGLTDALTGHSLAPALDTTREATTNLDQAQQSLAKTNSDAVTSASLLQTALKGLVSGLGAPPGQGTLSPGDPLSSNQIGILAAGGQLNNLNLSTQQMAIVNQDVSNYAANMATYTAAMGQYNTAVNQLNSAVSITEKTTGDASSAITMLGQSAQIGAATSNDLSAAVVSLADAQGSTATSAAGLGAQIGALQQQLFQTQSDAGGSAASLEATNTAASALQDGMGELYNELQSVEMGGTAAQGAAEYLATTFGGDTSGLTGAMAANAAITGQLAQANNDAGYSFNATTDAVTGAGAASVLTAKAVGENLTTAVNSLGTAATNAVSALGSLSSTVSSGEPLAVPATTGLQRPGRRMAAHGRQGKSRSIRQRVCGAGTVSSGNSRALSASARFKAAGEPARPGLRATILDRPPQRAGIISSPATAPFQHRVLPALAAGRRGKCRSTRRTVNGYGLDLPGNVWALSASARSKAERKAARPGLRATILDRPPQRAGIISSPATAPFQHRVLPALAAGRRGKCRSTRRTVNGYGLDLPGNVWALSASAQPAASIRARRPRRT